jgi:Ti-type conjugative transfer relaxase TraA
LVNGQTGEVSDYRVKGVQHVEILLPSDAPSWAVEIRDLVREERAKGLQALSDRVESAEKRKDSQVYREFEFSLPKEISEAQNIALANEFVQDQCCGRGMLAIQNFHFDVDAKTGEKKPHCHTLLLTRSLTEEGLSPLKERAWNGKEFHNTLREQWAQYQNFHLKRYGFEARVDHRSYAAQGIDLEPQPKLGKNVLAFEERAREKGETLSPEGTPKGFKSWRFKDFMDTKARNTYQLLSCPQLILKAAASNQSVFGLHDITRVIHRHVDDPEVRERLLEKALASSALVRLPSKEGEVRYTTQELLKSELTLVEKALVMSQRDVHGTLVRDTRVLNTRVMERGQTLGSETLSEEQEKALSHMMRGAQLSCLVGVAGSGKTTTLKAAQQRWREAGFNVVGFAPTGRAAQTLSESGINAQTLHRFLYQFEQGRCQFNAKTVVVLDEAGMVDIGRMEKFLGAVEALGVKAVVVGDGAQLQAIEAGDAFRLVTRFVEPFVMVDVRRQVQDWQKEATKAFGRQETEVALGLYLEKGHVTFVEETVPSLEKLKEAGDFKGVVALYALSRRLSGRLWAVGHQEGVSTREGKPGLSSLDKELFQTWQDLKLECASHMAANLDACRVHMKALKVDPLSFAETFVSGETREARLKEAREVVERWQLPAPDPHGPHGPSQPLADTRKATREALAIAWRASRLENPTASHLMLAYSNADVQSLNAQARDLMRRLGKIQGPDISYKIQVSGEKSLTGQPVFREEERSFATGDRLLFCKNDRGLDVKNGMIGTVVSLSACQVVVQLDGDQNTPGRQISFSPPLYKSFDHGWAVTLHKAQGITVDRVFKLASFEEYRNLAYVGMTRHREDVQVFGSTLDFWREEVFLQRLSSAQDKSLAHDTGDTETLTRVLESHAHSKLSTALETLGNRLEAMGFLTKHLYQKTLETFFHNKDFQVPHRPLKEPQPMLEREGLEKASSILSLAKAAGIQGLDPFLQRSLEEEKILREKGERWSQAHTDTLLQRVQYEEKKWGELYDMARKTYRAKTGIEKLTPLDTLKIEKEAQKMAAIESRIFVEHACQGHILKDSEVFILARREMKQLSQDQAALEKGFLPHHTAFVAKSLAEEMIHRKALYGADPTPDQVQRSLHLLKDMDSKDVERLAQIQQALEKHPLKGHDLRDVAEYVKVSEKEERLRSLAHEGASPHQSSAPASLEKVLEEFEKKATQLENQMQRQQVRELRLVH